MKQYIAIGLIAAFAACETAPPAPLSGVSSGAPPVPDRAEDTCNANRYVALIGQDATALERVLLLGQVRVIRPGQPVTSDFRMERINFIIGTNNQITAVRCY